MSLGVKEAGRDAPPAWSCLSSVAQPRSGAWDAYCFGITDSRTDEPGVRPKEYLPVVTISASYGAGGSVIAPRLAQALEIPFVDRLISADMSQDVARSERLEMSGGSTRSEEGLTDGEQMASPSGRFLSYFARAASVGAMMAPDAIIEDDDGLRRRVAEGLRPIKAGGPGVVLGRAGAVVLASRPRTYHVRLDGPVERRIGWASQFEHLSPATASRRQAETDRARMLFVKRLYRVDASDHRLYHLVLDPTVIGAEASVSVIATAARAFFEANPG